MKKLDNLDDIRDDQIRIIGGNVLKPRQQWFKRPAIIATLAIVIIALLILSWWQYNKAVEKSRLTEALQNVRVIEDCFKIFQLENGDIKTYVKYATANTQTFQLSNAVIVNAITITIYHVLYNMV